jgi:pre-mRNA-splicing helicase BRR2
VYNAVVGHAASAPTVVFVPSRKQCQLTAIDLMTYASASGSPGRFCTASEERMAPVLESIKDPALKQTLGHGVGFVHPGLAKSDRERVEALYRDGVILVVVVPASYCWSLELTALLVVIMGTETYDGREHRYVDYPVTDMLQMIGKAGRPLTDASGKCVVLCHTPKKEYLKRLLHEPLPVESHLDHFLHDHINAEIVTKTVENKQYAVDYLTWTFYYRRLAQNPNYYNLTGMTHRHLSDHLSELVEAVVSDLEESRCIAVKDDFELTALNLGMIAGYYYIQYTTIELFASSVTAKTKVRGLLEIVASASEYATLAIRHGDDRVLQKLAAHLPQKLPDDAKFTEPHIKALILLQCHFSREPLPVDLRNDLDLVLSDALRLLQALVDVISSNGWLKPALAVMELSQMIVQGLWDRDHTLLQVPHFTREIVARCEASTEEVEAVLDILNLDDAVRDELLQLPPHKMSDVAAFCNNYPNIDVAYEIADSDSITAGDAVNMIVKLEREVDDDDDDDAGSRNFGQVNAPRYPKSKTEGWWLVVGDVERNTLMSIKRVTLQQRAQSKLDFVAPDEPGEYTLQIFLMSDSFLGCDQQYEVTLSVGEAESEDEDEDEDEMES